MGFELRGEICVRGKFPYISGQLIFYKGGNGGKNSLFNSA